MNSKHRKTLEAILADPIRTNIPWDDIEAILVAMGAERYEGKAIPPRSPPQQEAH